MTSLPSVGGSMSIHDAADRITQVLRRRVERWLPWYDVEAELERSRRTEDIRQQAISVRIRTEKRLKRLGVDYKRADGVLRRGR